MNAEAYSQVSGDVVVPLITDTIGEALSKAARQWGNRIALVCPAQSIRWTWSELLECADAFAAGLLSLGLARGDRIGIWSLNRMEWVVTQFAAARAGLILVTINPAYRLVELEFALNKVNCKALVTATAYKTSEYARMIHTLAPELGAGIRGHLDAERLPHLRFVVQMGEATLPGAFGFEEVLELGAREISPGISHLAASLRSTDPINIQFTSGTTGVPKGVTLSHHNILNNGFFVGGAQKLTPDDRICAPVPLYHCFGMVMANLAAVTHGAAMVFPGEGFDPSITLRTVAEERCTALYGVPTMFIAELDHPDFAKHDLSSLRTGIMAGAPCPIEVMKKVVDRMHMRDVTIAYGMTETSPVSFQSAGG